LFSHKSKKNLGQLYGEFTVQATNLETHKLINDPDPPQAAVSFLPCKIKLKKDVKLNNCLLIILQMHTKTVMSFYM
jgi:hypothetical protein